MCVMRPHDSDMTRMTQSGTGGGFGLVTGNSFGGGYWGSSSTASHRRTDQD